MPGAVKESYPPGSEIPLTDRWRILWGDLPCQEAPESSWGDVSTASTLPILATPSPVTKAFEGEPGVETPGAIVVRSCRGRGPALTVELQGEVDCASVGPLHVLLTAAVARGYRSLLLDTSRVTFADSALLHVIDRWSRYGGTLRLGPRSPAVDRLIDAARRNVSRAAMESP